MWMGTSREEEGEEGGGGVKTSEIARQSERA